MTESHIDDVSKQDGPNRSKGPWSGNKEYSWIVQIFGNILSNIMKITWFDAECRL